MRNQPVIVRDPDIAGGEAVFTGTRVPVSQLVEFLTSDRTVSEFIQAFPSVEWTQIECLLETLPEANDGRHSESRRT